MPVNRCFIGAAATAAAATTLHADIVEYQFTLTVCQEVPPSDTTGFGEATVLVDTDTGEVTVTGSYEDMSSNVNAAHVHGPAAIGENAGIIFPLTHTGGQDGTLTGTAVLEDADIQTILDGLAYVNVHTVNFGPGEIRGQILHECRGDFNGDGDKNILDFVAYQNAFLEQTCEADLNHDLAYNILDFVEFQGVFQESCD